MGKQLTLGSLFDGIAGFPLAAVRHGIKPIWASEILPDCVDITEKHFPDMQQLGDITKIRGADITPVDIISFGSPCQNLSIAGNRKGLAGEASQLFFEAVRIIDEMRCATNGKYPKYAIWENVAGAFSSNKGQDFRRVLEEITKSKIPMPASGKWAAAGMVRSSRGDTAWRQLDAQYWGVPQRRKRVYLVHDFGGRRSGEILFECESVLGDIAAGAGEGKGSAGSVENSTAGTDSGGMAAKPDGQMIFDFGRTADRVYINTKKSVALKATDGGSGASTGLYLLPVYTVIGNTIGRLGKGGGNQLGIADDGIAPTLTENDRHAVCAPKSKILRCSFNLTGYGEYKEGVGPLRAKGGNNGGGSENLITEEKKKKGILKYIVRRLTPIECERLNGFPDGWTQYGASGKEMSDNARYKALGNSIAIPCAERVFIGILAAESEVIL